MLECYFIHLLLSLLLSILEPWNYTRVASTESIRWTGKTQYYYSPSRQARENCMYIEVLKDRPPGKRGKGKFLIDFLTKKSIQVQFHLILQLDTSPLLTINGFTYSRSLRWKTFLTSSRDLQWRRVEGEKLQSRMKWDWNKRSKFAFCVSETKRNKCSTQLTSHSLIWD